MKFLVAWALIFTGLSVHAEKIRIGWQVPWSVQGQLVQILKHTDILKKHKLDVEFVGKTYGPELNELALASAVDVILTADQPAATLFSKTDKWVGIARLMYNRTSTYVPPASPIQNLAGLKGKTVGVPIGAAAQRVLNQGLAEQKLDPSKDLKVINLGMPEHIPLISRAKKNATKWDQFDALSGFDPIPAILEGQGLVRTIHSGKVCSLIIVKKDYFPQSKELMKNLVSAFAEAYEFYNKNPEQADKWFLAEARLPETNSKAMKIAASFEPNLNGTPVRMQFNEEDLNMLQDAADFVAQMSHVKINMKDFVSNEYLK